MKRLLLLVFSFLLLMMSWEGQLTSANVLDNGPIPQESIRLRIIANSDSVQDQWLKREVRDALIAKMNSWADQIKTYDEAQEFVAARLPELQQVVDQTIRDRGFSHAAVVDFGLVPFPTKMYGSYVYPAGEYQALRVSIGEAKGQNWWCVLFPPLCFIDMSNGDVAGVTAATTVAEPTEPENRIDTFRDDWQREQSPVGDVYGADAEESVVVEGVEAVEETAEASEETAPAKPEAPEIQVKFFLLEKLEGLFS
jgi:stage II sporulation protein R